MNRELKFRVWDNLNKSFIYFDIQDYPSGVYGGVSYPQQFSGLIDRNGKKVYEGDILVEDHDGGEGEANIGQVYFAAGSFFINGDGLLYDHTYSLSPEKLEDYTVQGNVFENPELVKETQS